MPILRTEITAGNQFTGADTNTGLFDPDNIGLENQQVRINTVSFHGQAGITVFTISLVDPVNSSNVPVLIQSPGDAAGDNNFVQGLGLLLPNEGATTQGKAGSWGLRFVTTGMTGDGTLVIDYDVMLTES